MGEMLRRSSSEIAGIAKLRFHRGRLSQVSLGDVLRGYRVVENYLFAESECPWKFQLLSKQQTASQ
jgi:hypothetical protein